MRLFFELLAAIPERNPQAAARIRSAFLNQVHSLRQMPISKMAVPRHKMQKRSLFQILVAKGYRHMIQLMLAFVVSVALLVGGSGVAYVVPNSLPGDTVYPAKTLGEQVQLSLATQTQEKLDLLQKLVNRRVEEMVLLQYRHQPIPAETALRMSEQMDAMLKLAARLPDQEMQQALMQIRTHATVHEMLVRKFTTQGDGIVEQTRARLQEQIRLANMGLADPQGFRETVRQRFQNQNRQGSTTGTANPAPSRTPGSNGKGPNATPSPQGNDGPSGTSTGPGPGGPNKTSEPGGPGNGGPGDNGSGDSGSGTGGSKKP